MKHFWGDFCLNETSTEKTPSRKITTSSNKRTKTTHPQERSRSSHEVGGQNRGFQSITVHGDHQPKTIHPLPEVFHMEPEKGPPEIRRSLLKTIPFRFHVKLWGCTLPETNSFSHLKMGWLEYWDGLFSGAFDLLDSFAGNVNNEWLFFFPPHPPKNPIKKSSSPKILPR